MPSRWLLFAVSYFPLLILSQAIDDHEASSHLPIPRRSIVTRFNPTRKSTLNATTPMQVGNGNFAFGSDITSLQTFLPFATMASWGWKNDSLPEGRTQADIDAYEGVSWDNHGRPVRYDFGGPPDIEAWLRGSPNRVNLGRVGLRFWSQEHSGEGKKVLDVAETDLEDAEQTLDMWTGILTSRFKFDGEEVEVRVASDFETDTIAIELESNLVRDGRLGLFVDFPWNEGKEKFSAPFVGLWDVPEKHSTNLTRNSSAAQIVHQMESNIFYTDIRGDNFAIVRQSHEKHIYDIEQKGGRRPSKSLSISASFSGKGKSNTPQSFPSVSQVIASSKKGWEMYWMQSGFVDVLTGSSDSRAEDLQRRIVLSRYLMRVNEAGDTPPQESGLVNNGWFGKFHMEMYFWHSAHWALWGNWDVLHRSSSIYSRFLPAATTLAQKQQGWSKGARWPKMADPSGRSAPGEINNLLIWQQPHPLIFALYEYRAFPNKATLRKWREVVKATADWMSDFAWKNATTGRCDLGPPMYVVSEDTSPNSTVNPAFELAYWRLGLEIAEGWFERLGEEVPTSWTETRMGLAPLPVGTDDHGEATYSVYDGIEQTFWTDSKYTSDHPALVGLYGWLPATEGLDLDLAKRTAQKVWTHWNTSNCWGWDFPMLAMSAARNRFYNEAVDFLLHPEFQFDDIGMPIGGARVPTPYFPGSGSLLYAVAMMARGWDSAQEDRAAPGFPEAGWHLETFQLFAFIPSTGSTFISPMATNVVVLGGGAAGVKVIRGLTAKLDPAKHNLILITPRPEYANLIGALRLMVDPETAHSTVFMPYTRLFGSFPGTIIQGTATSIEETKFEITRMASRGWNESLRSAKGAQGAERFAGGCGGIVTLDSGIKVEYDVIVLATGSAWEGILAFPNDPQGYIRHVETWRRKFRDAQDILIVGGGPVGVGTLPSLDYSCKQELANQETHVWFDVETAGEIKDAYPSKRVTIIQGDRLLLNDIYPDKFRRDIQRRLEARGVEIILNDAVSGNPSPEKPVKTREGQELTCDLVVTVRGSGANTQYLKFLKPNVLTERGYIKVKSTFEVLYHPGMFALGDIVDWPEVKQLAKINMGHADVVVKNVLQYINSERMTHSYQGSRDFMAVSNGRNGGSTFVGLWWGLVLGNRFTSWIKSRTLLVEMAQETLGIVEP
ncbi:hypothetical protein NMY22_g3430 [Coprinellus aureogranulatus]|nr:hypothetical protein NMY22_g3430 [Coprinellus aureogranulatus]